MERTAGREAWLQERTTGIGSSDAAAVLGLSPYQTEFDVWLDKRGQKPPNKTSEPMYWGTALEDLIARRYSEETGNPIWNPERIFRHPEYDCIIATPDRLVLDTLGPTYSMGLECKTANFFAGEDWGEQGTDEIPRHYLVQVVHCMAVLDRDRWDVAVLIGGNDFRRYTVRRDKALEDGYLTRLSKWWQRHVVEGVEPEPTARTVDKWLDWRFPTESADRLTADAASNLVAELLIAARAVVANAEETERALTSDLKRIIGPHSGIAGDGWRASWKRTKDLEKVDWPAVAGRLRDRLDGMALGVGSVAFREEVERCTDVKEGYRRFMLTVKK